MFEFSLLYMAFYNNLEREKIHWRTFFWNQKWLSCVQHLWKIRPLTSFCFWSSSPEWESDLHKRLWSLSYHSEWNTKLLIKEEIKSLFHLYFYQYFRSEVHECTTVNQPWSDILILHTLKELAFLPPASLEAELNNCRNVFYKCYLSFPFWEWTLMFC